MSSTDTVHMPCWTPAWLQQVTNGRWLIAPEDSQIKLNGLGIDSRTLRPGQVFLAIKGEKFDGHRFIESAFKQGAAVAIIDQPDAAEACKPPSAILMVQDAIAALQSLASDYRTRLRDAGCTVIAVVGSNGKTTTRNLIHAVLASTLAGTQSPKSFNNHIGVPLTLLGASLEDDYLVAEVGTNHPGEINALGELLKPDSAVITCIGHEHMEFFGDLQGVAEEEASITRHLPANGQLFVEHDAISCLKQTESYKPIGQPVIFGPGKQNARDRRQLVGDCQRFSICDSISIDLPLLATHDVSNALAAVAVGRWMGIEDTAIKAALEQVKPMPGRLVVSRFADVTVIDDTYNANPDSMEAALNVLAELSAHVSARRVAVLGDMLELGERTHDAHRQVGRQLLEMAKAGNLHHIALVGPSMAIAYQTINQADTALSASHHAEYDESSLEAIAQAVQSGDIVLCKASRGLQLERLLPMIKHRIQQDESPVSQSPWHPPFAS